MRTYLPLCCLLLNSAYASQTKPLKAERVGQLVNQTFGTISRLDPEYFSRLKAQLVNTPNIEGHMITITSNKLTTFDYETEKKYHEAATAYIQYIFDERFPGWTFDTSSRIIQVRAQLTVYYALWSGFDRIISYFISRGINDIPSRIVTLNIASAINMCAKQQDDPEYHQRRWFYISAIKKWLAKCASDLKNEEEVLAPQTKLLIDSPEGRKARSEHFIFRLKKNKFKATLSTILAKTATKHEPETTALLILHGASPSCIRIPGTYLADIKNHWAHFTREVKDGKYDNEKSHLKDNAENRKFRTWDVRATSMLFEEFEKLRNERYASGHPTSHVASLPRELIREIEYFRFGIRPH